MYFFYLLVFPGDTLFIGGCGRFFEGNPEQMYTALVEILGSLPDDTVNLYLIIIYLFTLLFVLVLLINTIVLTKKIFLQKVFCGHEYTVANYKFAKHVEPHNQELLEQDARAKMKRERQEPTVPSTIGKFSGLFF